MISKLVRVVTITITIINAGSEGDWWDQSQELKYYYKFRHIPAKTTTFKNSFFPWTIPEWNALPWEAITSAISLNVADTSELEQSSQGATAVRLHVSSAPHHPHDTHQHDDVIKWKHFPRYWPFARGIHRSRWIPRTKASDAELLCFLSSVPE